MRPWEIWCADVVFEDVNISKRRPVLVIDEKTFYVMCFKITSHTPRDEFDYALENWAELGLKKASAVRLSRKLTLSKEKLLYKIGRLKAGNVLDIQTILAKSEQ